MTCAARPHRTPRGRRPLSVALVVAVTTATWYAPRLTADAGAQHAAVAVALPPGDSAAGRQAFVALKCHACHAVPSDPQMARPVSANPGPAIDRRLASLDVSYLLTAIVSPSHSFSVNTSPPVRQQLEGVLSPMGDYSRIMTVRQLVDLYAFIRGTRS